MNAVDHLPGRKLEQMNAQEAGSHYPRDIVGERHRPGEAVAPLFSVMHQILRNGLIGHDVGDRKSSTRFGDAKHFPEDLPFIRCQVDHTVGDDQIDGAVDHRYRVRHPFAKLDVGGGVSKIGCDEGGILSGDGQHRVSHVDPNDMSGRPDEPGGFKTIDAAT